MTNFKNMSMNNVKNFNEKDINKIFDQIRSNGVDYEYHSDAKGTIITQDGTIIGKQLKSSAYFHLRDGNVTLTLIAGDERLGIRVSYKALKRIIRLGIKLWNACIAFYSLIQSIETESRRTAKRLVKSGDIKVSKNF